MMVLKMNEDEKQRNLKAKYIYLPDLIIDEIKRQMHIHKSRYFSDHVRKALRIGLEILKEREKSLECTTEMELTQQ